MRKSTLILLIALMTMSLLSGCKSKSIPSEPPDIQVMIDNKEIDLGWTILKWDSHDYMVANPLKDFVTSSTKTETPYFEIGKTIDVSFSSNPPDSLAITESLLDEYGNLKYTDRETIDIPVELKNNKCSFKIANEPASALSSTKGENDKEIRGYRMTAAWGDNVCQYVFCIKTDAE